jgi:hypothetical protein
MASVPIGSASGALIFTWLGLKLYSDKLAKISVGSMLRKKEGAGARLVGEESDEEGVLEAKN